MNVKHSNAQEYEAQQFKGKQEETWYYKHHKAKKANSDFASLFPN